MKTLNKTIVPAAEYAILRHALHHNGKPLSGGSSAIVDGWDLVVYVMYGVEYEHHFSRDGMTGFIVIC